MSGLYDMNKKAEQNVYNITLIAIATSLDDDA